VGKLPLIGVVCLLTNRGLIRVRRICMTYHSRSTG
jgi:hypothetical protein